MQFFSLQRRIMHILNSLNHPFISIFKLCNHCTEQTIRIKDDVLSVLELLTNENVCNSCKCRFSLLILSLSLSHTLAMLHIYSLPYENRTTSMIYYSCSGISLRFFFLFLFKSVVWFCRIFAICFAQSTTDPSECSERTH